MNKIYKVVWSKAKQCYVVASELAKRLTKAPKSEIFSKVLVAGMLVCVLNVGIFGHVFAETHIRYDTSSIDEGQKNPDVGGYALYGDIYSITVTDGKLTGISFITTDGGDSPSYGYSQTYSLGASGGTAYTAGSGINISSDNKVSVKTGYGIDVGSNGVAVKAGTNVTVNSNGVSVTGNGSVADGNTGLINGDKLYDEVRSSANGNYVKLLKIQYNESFCHIKPSGLCPSLKKQAVFFFLRPVYERAV